jgi:hypothetical protein
LEQEAKAKEFGISHEVQYAVSDAMKISDDDRKLLDAIVDRGEPPKTSTPQVGAAFEQFSAEFERMYALIQRATGKVGSSENLSVDRCRQVEDDHLGAGGRLQRAKVAALKQMQFGDVVVPVLGADAAQPKCSALFTMALNRAMPTPR